MKKIILFKIIVLLIITTQAFGQWTNMQNINGIDYSSERFGRAVSISEDGSVLAVGAYRDGESYDAYGSLDQRGSVRIYTKDNTNTWVETAEITSDEIGGNFGYSLSLSADGNTLAIGAPLAGDGQVIDAGTYQYLSTNETGLVRIYSNNTGTWTQIGDDIVGETQTEFFGWSISIADDGNTFVAGAYGYDSETGVARVYKKDATDNWIKSTDLSGSDTGDKTGYAVSLSSDGNTVAVGAFQHDSYKGTTRTYSYNSSAWTQIGTDIDGEEEYDFSGFAISINADGTSLLIGAYSHNSNGTARLYNYSENNWNKEIQIDAEENTFERFGYAVSLAADATTFAVGASQSGNYIGTSRVYSKVNDTWTQQGDDMVGSADYEYSSSAISLANNGSTLAVGAYAGNYNDGVVRLYEYSDASLSTNDITFEEILYSIQNQQINVLSENISFSIYDLLGRKSENTNLKGVYVVRFIDETNGNKITKKVLIN